MTNILSKNLLGNIEKINLYYKEILEHILTHKLPDYKLFDQKGDRFNKIFSAMMQEYLQNPEKLTQVNIEYINDFQKLITNSINKFVNFSNQEAIDQEKSKDKRFQDPNWQQNIYFDFVKQYYLITSDWIKKSSKQYNFDSETSKYVEFAIEQFINAMSPSNFPLTNPEVIKKSFDTSMESLAKGMENFLSDIKKSGDLFNISTTDKSRFKIGKNLATTKGKVIYENDLMQLICYEPKEKTYSVPLLIVPPWINKYYILDLSEKNSLVKWLVDNNFQVFLISWVNPGKKMKNTQFDDYIKKGILDAYEQIKKIGYNKINALGYCIGGTALAAGLSYLKKEKKDYINSATFLTTLIDFAKPGQIGVFITEDFIKLIEEKILDTGYLDGRYISNSFSLIRANDLIWSFFVNNYLLGNPPAAFDILYWNSDSTNLPASMYLYYLKNMYIKNRLKNPDDLTILDRKINISEIDTPSFFVAAKKDHIALWDAVYDGYKMFKGEKTFCLTDAGHVAGVVNPPTSKKYSHILGNTCPSTGKKWLKEASKKEGSWWMSWKKWLIDKSGKLENGLHYESLNHIEDAPGRYVKKQW